MGLSNIEWEFDSKVGSKSEGKKNYRVQAP